MSAVLTIAGDTLRKVAEARFYRVLNGAAALVIVVSFFVAKLTIGNWDRTILDLGLSAIEAVSVVLAVHAGASRREEDERSRTRVPGASRRAYVFGRYLGFLGVRVASLAGQSALLFVVLAIADFTPSFASLSATLLLIVQTAFLGAVAPFASTSWNGRIAAAVTSALFVVGHVSAELRDLGERSGSAIVAAATSAFYWILPNLGLFDAKPEAANRLDVSARFTSSSAAYGILCTAAVLLLALAVAGRSDSKRCDRFSHHELGRHSVASQAVTGGESGNARRCGDQVTR